MDSRIVMYSRGEYRAAMKNAGDTCVNLKNVMSNKESKSQKNTYTEIHL